jgi:hypothetical protein
MNHTLDLNTLAPGTIVHTLGKRISGDPEFEGKMWEIEFVVYGNGVEVWSRGFLPEADTLPYTASRTDWSPIPLRSRIPLEWGRDLWKHLALSGFSVIYPPFRK